MDFLRIRFSEEKNIKKRQADILASSVGIMVDESETYVRELLYIIAPLLGNGVLSIIDVKTRKVLATMEDDMSDLEYMVKGLKNVGRADYYLRAEKNGVRFRKEFDCIQVVPLEYRGQVLYSLVAEQQTRVNHLTSRIVDVLSLAVQNYVLEERIKSMYYEDAATGLPNRDALLQKLEEGRDKKYYLGMFFLLNVRELSLGMSVGNIDGILREMAKVVSRHFPNSSYRVGETKMAVIVQGNLFECVSSMQNCLEELNQQLEQGKFGASITSADNDLYRMLYICEKACSSLKGDTVMVMRSKDGVLDEDMNVEQVYGAKCNEKEEDVLEDIIVESVEVNQTQREKRAEKSCEKSEAEEDLAFFYDLPDIDDDLDT